MSLWSEISPILVSWVSAPGSISDGARYADRFCVIGTLADWLPGLSSAAKEPQRQQAHRYRANAGPSPECFTDNDSIQLCGQIAKLRARALHLALKMPESRVRQSQRLDHVHCQNATHLLKRPKVARGLLWANSRYSWNIPLEPTAELLVEAIAPIPVRIEGIARGEREGLGSPWRLLVQP